MSLSIAHLLRVARHHHGMKNQASLSSSSLSLPVSSSQKLLFTTTTNNTNDNTTAHHDPKNNRPLHQRTRKRKSKSSHPPSLLLFTPQTTRDRIRWLQNHNQVLAADNYYRKRQYDSRLEDLGDTAEERLNWVRDKIYGFWRGGPSSVSNINNTTNSNNTATTKNRPKRVGPKMDSKWWFWNIAFALLPAFCIATYCELIGKPQMLEYNRQVHIHRQKQKYGDAYVEQHDDELTKLTRQAQQPLGITKLYNAIVELSLYFFLGGQTPATITADTAPPGTLQNSNSNNQQQHQQEQETNVKNNQNRAMNIDPKLTRQTVNQQSNDDAQTIAELKRRLEELENRLNNAQYPSTIETTETPPPKSITHNDSSIGQGQAVSEQLHPPQQHSRIHDRVLQRRALQGGQQPKETKSSSTAAPQPENSNNQTSLATLVSSKISTFWKSLSTSSRESPNHASPVESATTTSRSKTSDANGSQDTLKRSQQQQKGHSSTTSNKVGDSAMSDTAPPSLSMQKGFVSQRSKTTSQREEGRQQSTATIIKPDKTESSNDHDDDDDDDETRKQATAKNSERSQTQGKTAWFRWGFWG